MSKQLILRAIACCLLLVTAAKSHAASDERLSGAMPAALAWAAQIDAGKYDESYLQASSALQEKVPQDRSNAVLRTLLPPWGKIVSRKEVRHVYKPDGLEQEHLDGECMIITFDTSFKNLPSAVEVIVVKWEGGKWRGAGYNIGPKSAGDQPVTAASQPQTETTTSTLNAPPGH